MLWREGHIEAAFNIRSVLFFKQLECGKRMYGWCWCTILFNQKIAYFAKLLGSRISCTKLKLCELKKGTHRKLFFFVVHISNDYIYDSSACSFWSTKKTSSEKVVIAIKLDMFRYISTSLRNKMWNILGAERIAFRTRILIRGVL